MYVMLLLSQLFTGIFFDILAPAVSIMLPCRTSYLQLYVGVLMTFDNYDLLYLYLLSLSLYIVIFLYP